MQQSELNSRSVTTSEVAPQPTKSRWFNFSWLDGLLLAVALIAVYLPVDWTRDLKRIKQAPLYAWQGFGYFAIYTLAVAWAFRPAATDQSYRRKWVVLTGLVLLPNLLNIWLRSTAKLPDGSLLFGRDADIGLFFKYGADFAQGHYPTNFQGQYMEYPQFALLLFWFGYQFSGGQAENFYWVFPALLLVFQLGAALFTYGIGRKLGRARAGFLLAAFVGGCPALMNFNYTRFDVAPAALLLAAIYFYLPSLEKVRGDFAPTEIEVGEEGQRNLTPAQNRKDLVKAGASGLLLTAGGLLKWLPAVALPWLIAGYVQARRGRQLLVFGLASTALALLTFGPFYLWNAEAFWYPYKFQGSRKMIGESFWFLIQRDFLDPAHTTPEKPWGEPATVILGNNKLLVAQLGLVGLVLLISLWWLWWARPKALVDWQGWAGAGLVGVAVFTLANRVFSPQYMVLLAWVWVVTLLMRPARPFSLVMALALISVATSANFQVYLLGVYPEEWVRDSWVMFAASGLLCGWLLYRLSTPSKTSTVS
jgi:hypothetical protein